jgi:Skp family chaperone for outer membrane proteins
VKRTLFLLVGVIALGTAIYASSKLWAQTPGAVATGTKTKVGVLNLTYVIKNYSKFKTYQDQLKAKVDPFQLRDTGYKTEGEKLAKQAQQPQTTAVSREGIEKRLKELQRLIEDNKAEAQKVLVKEQEAQLVTLYKDIRNVVDKFAVAHGYDLVMHYNDVITPEEYWSPPNIARKMQAGAAMPMYISGGVDISASVLATLNAASGGTTTTTPVSTTGTGTSSR